MLKQSYELVAGQKGASIIQKEVYSAIAELLERREADKQLVVNEYATGLAVVNPSEVDLAPGEGLMLNRYIANGVLNQDFANGVSVTVASPGVEDGPAISEALMASSLQSWTFKK